ncbi:hypothetical protein LWI29_009425 [Acer saccharum]|uniref:DUF4283 domain-containing protein n=1 Tax=Acer saccharum TaxID=4024 RepID=A0AA39SPC1_ACESA|nr:hypothetical protein LWI29_009425 [Acer saccharum]
MKFNRVAFWIQIHNVPKICMVEIARFLGSMIGEVKKVDTGKSGDCVGKYICVHVVFNVDKPLRILRVDVMRDGKESVMLLRTGDDQTSGGGGNGGRLKFGSGGSPSVLARNQGLEKSSNARELGSLRFLRRIVLKQGKRRVLSQKSGIILEKEILPQHVPKKVAASSVPIQILKCVGDMQGKDLDNSPGTLGSETGVGLEFETGSQVNSDGPGVKSSLG